MHRDKIARALRSAVLLGLAAPAPVACGGSVAQAPTGTDSSTAPKDSDGAAPTGADSSSPKDSDGAAPTGADSSTMPRGSDAGSSACAISSTTPSSVSNGGSCEETFPLNGSAQSCGVNGGGSIAPSQCATLCPKNSFSGATAMTCLFSQLPSQQPPTTLSCTYAPCGTGRRPEGLVPLTNPAGPSWAARALAAMAYLEAASVQAFIRLARELEAHGAPLALQRAAERAALDEVRHARVTKALAENEGGCVPAVRAARQRHRSLEAIAIDNAVEGCVRETFGAAVAAMQAARAGDAAVRTAMGPIARDEANHASLSWRLAAWLDTKLDVDARGRVENARSRAVDDLAREIAVEPAERDRHALGLPNASTRHAVLNALRASLWS